MTTTFWTPPGTRLSAPILGSVVLDRPRLLEQLDDAIATAPLTLVLGYPGSGKSTLLTTWLRWRAVARCAWLSCDEAEREPHRFWHAIVASLRRLDPAIGADILDAYELEGEVTRDSIAALVDDMTKHTEPVVLVIDDLQEAADRRLWPLLTAFIEWLPSWHRVVISSRSEPVLPLPRWRIEGRLAEIRNPDLAFQHDEVKAFLSALGAVVDDETAEFVGARTEGWAAGLQLAGLNIRDNASTTEFLREFAATDRHLVDYLVGEVLELQPRQIVQFLMATAILGELEHGICAALTGDSAAGQRLAEIEAAGLFLIPLDRDRRRYRYHHLFADMLRNRMRRDQPDRKNALHRSAAAWYADHGEIGRAVHHAVRGDDAGLAISLLRDHVVHPYFTRETISPTTLIDAVDAQTLRLDRELTLEYALAIGMAGALEPAGSWLRHLRSATGDDAGKDFEGRLTAAEAMLDMAQGRADRALDRIARVRSMLSSDAPLALQLINTEARCRHYIDDLDGVRRIAADAEERSLEPFAAIVIAGAHAGIENDAGCLDEADRIARGAIRLADEIGTPHFSVADALRVVGAVLLERGQLDEAELTLEQALRISEGKRPINEMQCLVDQSALLFERDRVDDALDVLSSAADIVTRLDTCPSISARVTSAQARMLIAVGAVARAAEHAATMPLGARRGLIEARIALARNQYPAANAVLSDLATGGWPRVELEVALLRARTNAGLGRSNAAVDHDIEQALRIADQHRFLRTVVIELHDIPDALGRNLRRAETGTHRALIAEAARTRLPVHREPLHHGTSLELSDRECEVLRYLSTQMSNREIAGELYVSLNTLKTHIRSLYRKLDASTRTQAVIAGHNRGLL